MGRVSEAIKAIGKSSEQMGEAGDKLFTSKEEKGNILTKRQEIDSNTESWLPKNVRPLVFLGLFLLLAAMVISSGFGAVFSQAIFTLIGTLAASAFGFYFGERNARKAMKEFTKKMK